MADQKRAQFIHSTIPTPDGGAISYYSIGNGPGIIIVHGAISYGLSHRELAELLSDSYTVHLISRRNRGLSSQYPESIIALPALVPAPSSKENNDEDVDGKVRVGGVDYQRTYDKTFSSAVVQTDLSDINLLVEETSAVFALGISSGAILLLAASASPSLMPSLSKLRNILIFEPPMQFSDLDTGLDVMGARRYEDEMQAGDITSAMVTAMKLVQLGPGWIPRPVMKFLSGLMLWSENRKSTTKEIPDTDVGDISKMSHGNTTMSSLAPVLRYDFAVVENMVGSATRFADIAVEGDTGRKILLLQGANSPGYTSVVMNQLEDVIKGANRVTLENVGHEVLCNRDFRGNPSKAIGIIKDFFK